MTIPADLTLAVERFYSEPMGGEFPIAAVARHLRVRRGALALSLRALAGATPYRRVRVH